MTSLPSTESTSGRETCSSAYQGRQTRLPLDTAFLQTVPHNEVRLHLNALAYDLATFLHCIELPEEMADWSHGARHPRCHSPPSRAAVMRATTIPSQMPRNRLDKSVRRAEKRLKRPSMSAPLDLLRRKSRDCRKPTAIQSEKQLIERPRRLILPRNGRPLGECRTQDDPTANAAPRFQSYPTMIHLVMLRGTGSFLGESPTTPQKTRQSIS